MKQVPILLPDELHEFAKSQAESKYQSFAGYVRALIVEDKQKQESLRNDNDTSNRG